jgi:hypothetical protein
MKLKNLILLFLASLLFVMCAPRRAVVVNNPSPPPMWGPMGYETVRYYYLPDLMVYYDVHTAMFMYPRGNRWVYRSYLPGYYGNFDLYHTYKVVLHDYYGPAPYQYFNNHRSMYAVGYRGNSVQATIGRRENDRRNYFAPNRSHSANAPGRRGDNTSGTRNTTSTSTRNTTTSGTRSETTSGTRNTSSSGTRATIPADTRNETTSSSPATTPSNRVTPTRTDATRASTPPARAQVQPSETVRPNPRLNTEDARATKKRTQELRQQSRSSTPVNVQPSRSTTPSRTRG